MSESNKIITVEGMERFFNDFEPVYNRAEKRRRELERASAPHFNVFNWIRPDENRLSDILADLLDPGGSHGQGDIFLRLLLEMLKMPLDSEKTEMTTVYREALTYNIKQCLRRIDVLLEIESDIFIALENKLYSGDQPHQLKDYMEHLEKCCERTGKISVLIFLAPNKRIPTSIKKEKMEKYKEDRRLFCWSYTKDIRSWLIKCRGFCCSERVRIFLGDFMAYIRNEMTDWSEEDE